MKKYRLKKKFLVVFYILVMVSFIGAIFAVDVYLKEDNKKNPEIKYINKNVIDNDIPVINVESTTIGKPHNNENVKKEKVMSENKIPYKIYLEEQEMPTEWYNVRADMKKKPAPLLHPGTHQPMTEDELEIILSHLMDEQEKRG